MDCGDASGVRLDFAKLFRSDRAKPGNPVLPAPLEERREPRPLFLGRRDDDLSCHLERDPVLLAETHHLAASADGDARLERAGLVVDAGMKNPAVVPGLVAPDGLLLLQHKDGSPGLSAQKLEGGREPHDPAAHHRHVVHEGVMDRGRPCRQN